MGRLTVKLPIEIHGSFRIKGRKSAENFVKHLEQIADRLSPFDDVLGIWKDRSEEERSSTESLRDRNNRRNT
jgi:hypothetical protein